MDVELGEVGAMMSEANQSVDHDANGGEGVAWCSAQSKDLQLQHRPRQVDDDIIIYP